MFYNLLSNKGDIKVPEMDVQEALRRILGILNYGFSMGDGLNPGGESLLAGSTFVSIADIIVVEAGKAVQCAGSPSPRGVLVVADPNNTGAVYVGGSGVTNATGSQRGLILTQAGMPSQVLPVSTTSLIYVNADNAGDRVGIVIL